MHYGHALKFGTFIPPLSTAPEQVVARALRSEALGYDLVTFQDHPYQPAFLERLKKIETENSPLFERYVTEKDPKFYDCCKMNLREVKELITTHRILIINHIFSLNESVLKRTGRHPVYGDLAIPQWIEFFLLHEAHHLLTIFKLLNGPDH